MIPTNKFYVYAACSLSSTSSMGNYMGLNGEERTYWKIERLQLTKD